MQCLNTDVSYICTADALRNPVPLVKDKSTLSTRLFLEKKKVFMWHKDFTFLAETKLDEMNNTVY
uniref:Uncharacterized protein n=1 Tax=Nelumbo nucifera TaxID=4432 RepID=A0A822ZS34_NELNU|nr:TPA_asm: hypothetical protein HUJ06_004591 [Nelumbo nucifera]